MAEENKTFAEQSAEKLQLSESDKIRERIQNYKAQLTPNTLQVIQILIESQLKSGLIKPADLDAIVVLRDEVNKASIEYNTQVQNASKRLEDLAETEAAEKAAAQEEKWQTILNARDTERQRRKESEDKLAQMEAVLASHGISMDLNQDGVIGLQDGQVARELTDDEQKEVDNLVQVDKDNIAEAPVEPKEPSRAFQMARALNPDTSVSEQMQDELEPINVNSHYINHDIKQSHTVTSNLSTFGELEEAFDDALKMSNDMSIGRASVEQGGNREENLYNEDKDPLNE